MPLKPRLRRSEVLRTLVIEQHERDTSRSISEMREEVALPPFMPGDRAAVCKSNGNAVSIGLVVYESSLNNRLLIELEHAFSYEYRGMEAWEVPLKPKDLELNPYKRYYWAEKENLLHFLRPTVVS